MDMNSIIVYLSCLVLLFVIGKIFIVPLKLVLKVLINSVLGGILIFLINLVGAMINFHIGLNIGTALMVGILGIPGAVLLILIKLFI